MRRPLRLLALTLVFPAGCAGDGMDLVSEMGGGGVCGDGTLDSVEECDDGNGVDGDGCSAGCSDETTTLAYIQANIFTPICSRCHRPGGIGPMPLDSEAASLQSLVDRPSIERTELLRVEPGNAADSYLFWKIDPDPAAGRVIVGGRMPLGLPPLTQQEIDSIVRWIDNGARP